MCQAAHVIPPLHRALAAVGLGCGLVHHVGVPPRTPPSMPWGEGLPLTDLPGHPSRMLTALLSLGDGAWSPWGRFGCASGASVARLYNSALPGPSFHCM